MRQSVFIGRVTVQPELRKTETGTSVLNLEVLVRERKGEGWEDHRFSIVCWGMAAERVARQAAPGCEVVAFCKPESRTYRGRDGRERKSQDHVASWIRVCQPEDPGEVAS